MGNKNSPRTTSTIQSSARRRNFGIRGPLQWLRPDTGSNNGSLVVCDQPTDDCPVCYRPTETLLCYSACPVYKARQSRRQDQPAGQLLHSACRNCWLAFICTAIDAFAMGQLACIGCDVPLNPAVTLHLLQQHAGEPRTLSSEDLVTPCGVCGKDCRLMFSRYEEFILRKALVRERNMRWCPYACGYGVIALGFKACPRLQCLHRDCGQEFCFICQRPWLSGGNDPTPSTTARPADAIERTHECTFETTAVLKNRNTFGGVADLFGLNGSIITAISPGPSSGLAQGSRTSTMKSEPNISGSARREAIDRRASHEEPASSARAVNTSRWSSNSSHTSSSGKDSAVVEQAGEIKPCPNCGVLIEKSGDGCNSVTCSLCTKAFCWLCERPISSFHFASFSGCTLWGRRRWPVGKCIVAYIVTLFLTPIVLPLVAVALLIFFIVFIPAWLFSFVPDSSTTGEKVAALVASIIVTPVLTALVVPLILVLLLLYVYVGLLILLVRSVYVSSREDRKSRPAMPLPVGQAIGETETAATRCSADYDVEAGVSPSLLLPVPTTGACLPATP